MIKPHKLPVLAQPLQKYNEIINDAKYNYYIITTELNKPNKIIKNILIQTKLSFHN